MSIERLGNNKAKFTVSRGYDLRGRRIRYFKTVTYKSERSSKTIPALNLKSMPALSLAAP